MNEVLSETTGILAFYGAFKIGGTCEESNEAVSLCGLPPQTSLRIVAYADAVIESPTQFDKTLRERDPRFGLRDMEKIEQLAACADLRVLARSDPSRSHRGKPSAGELTSKLVFRRQMPSNNWMLVLGRTNQPPL